MPIILTPKKIDYKKATPFIVLRYKHRAAVWIQLFHGAWGWGFPKG
jgi:hypothetical protein